MENVTGMVVMQTRVFAPDIVPYRLIVTPLGTNLLKQTLGFRDASWNQENWDYVFQDGTFEYRSITVPIIWLGFNDRRILIQVQGDSDAALAAYSSVRGLLTDLAPDFQNPEPLLFSQETSCSVKLDFEWTSLLSTALVEQVNKRAKEVSTEEIGMAVKGLTLRFTLGAARKSELLTDYGITIFDQTIAIEPKANVPLSERVYFTYSPCDSDTHLKLVTELEISLASKASRPGRKSTKRLPARRKIGS